MTEQSDGGLEQLTERETADRCELCRNSPLSVSLRPTCVEGREVIPLMCDGCYVALRQAGRLDLERDAEVFGYDEFE